MSERPNHLQWNGTEWVDDRCGCRYHPDDDNGSHGGAPHVHLCETHALAVKGTERIVEVECGVRRSDADQVGSWTMSEVKVTLKAIMKAMLEPAEPPITCDNPWVSEGERSWMVFPFDAEPLDVHIELPKGDVVRARRRR